MGRRCRSVLELVEIEPKLWQRGMGGSEGGEAFDHRTSKPLVRSFGRLESLVAFHDGFERVLERTLDRKYVMVAR